MTPYILAALAAAALVGSGVAYLTGRSDGEALAVAQDVRERHVAALASQAAASAAAAQIARIRVQHTTVRQEVEREIREKPVYVDCRHSPDQLQRLNAAITGADSEPARDGRVPRADPAVRPQLRRDDAEADRGGGPVP